MIPHKLIHGDDLQDLFDRFNAVIDYLAEIRLVPGPGIRLNKLHSGITVEALPSGGGSSGGSSGGGWEYNGYFKIVDASEGETLRVLVVDGATYDPETGTSGPSYAYLNGAQMAFPAWTAERPAGMATGYVRIHVHFDEQNAMTKALELAYGPAPSGTSSDVYFDLGRVFFGDTMTIQQDFFGIPRFERYAECVR